MLVDISLLESCLILNKIDIIWINSIVDQIICRLIRAEHKGLQ